MEENTPVDENQLICDSGDVGWKTGVLVDPNNPNVVRCILCEKITKAGINRHKFHIAGIKGRGVKPCPNASDEQKKLCYKALEENKSQKLEKILRHARLRDDVIMTAHISEEEETHASEEGSRKRPFSALGPLDKFTRQINITDESTSASKKMKQQNINDLIDKKRVLEVHQYLCRWVYEAGIPFNSINCDSFKMFVEALGRYGPGYTPPSQYQLRETLLKAEVERTKEMLKKQEEEWKANGCSVMTDAWTDGRKRSIMNLCVNCKLGTTFLSSKDTKDDSHTGEYIFEYVDRCIQEIGEENVVQVVTDNASNNMAAASFLSLKRPKIFWTSCGTHTINLMLEAISKLPNFKGVIQRAKSFTVFIYAHHKTLALMRKFTQREIVRPGVTRFASSFLTLQSLLEKKQELKSLVTSLEWDNTKLSKTVKGKEAYETIIRNQFWDSVELCLRVFTPLVKVLRLVDGDDKPSMGFAYGELLRAKEDIKDLLKKECDYLPILYIIDSRSEDRLDSPLHTSGYLLNPYYFFKSPSIKDDHLITSNLITCVEKFFPNEEMQHHEVNVELQKYTKKEGAFGRKLAVNGCKNNDSSYNPVSWWDFYGNETPHLKFMAKRILGLTTSSSGCERNWSTFEGIHTKKRNRLDATRMQNLVYVQFNARLANRKRKKDKLEAFDATNAQGWIVDGCDDDDDVTNAEISGASTNGENEIREPDEEDFESDGEEAIMDEEDYE
ncbi:unnamed protein product [Cuscuta epithymum]|uniref:Uncharacterized protein n=1 Tax=Cuscuta epithymum TaxID=186058 RepID=A0AAV0EJE3_9ASTE|nr:unnamed protein product [Cuscuta epithymum]